MTPYLPEQRSPKLANAFNMTKQTIPPGWAITTLAGACLVVQGQSPPGETYNTDGIGLPFLQGKAEFGDVYPSPVKWCSAPSKIAETDDVLISIRAPVGPTNLCAVQSCIGRGLAAIRTQGTIPSKFVLYAIRATDEELRAKSTGTTFEAIRGDNLRSHPFPLAPLPEQHRIVAEIEKQFTRLDASVESLKRAQANLKRYRASVLKSACEGSLVRTEAELARAEGRDYEPAGVLLERILKERRARWETQPKRRGKYKEPSAPDTSDLPNLPEGWVWVSLDHAVLSLEGGTAVAATNAPSNRIVLRSSAVRHGFIDLEDCRFLSEDSRRALDPYVATGDLLFTRLSGTLDYVGNCAVVGELNGQKVEFPDRIFRGRCTPNMSPHFIQFCFAERTLRQPLEAKAKSTAGHQRISLSDLRGYSFPLPPLAEQQRIVAEVERRLSVIQQAEATVTASLALADRLRQSILKQAFSGQLIPQDPDDEPASVLLERIRAEREAAKAWAVKPPPRTRRRAKPGARS